MKKRLTLVLLLFLSVARVGYASDFRDNRFKLDSSRMEQEKGEDTLGNQSTLIKDLFSESDQKKLADLQKTQLSQLLEQKDNLFSSGQVISTKRGTDSLFRGQQGLVETKVDAGSAERTSGPLWLSLLYTGLIIGMVLGATYLTYRISMRDF